MKSRSLIAVAALVAAAGCQSTSPQDVNAPMDTSGSMESIWIYLSVKYDTNGDGEVTRSEYERDEEAFVRLDTDEDGTITPADFQRETEGGETVSMMGDMRAQIVILRYFQSDPDNTRLPVAELEESAVAYDEDGDGLITREEFERLAPQRERPLMDDDSPMIERMMNGVGSWEAVTGVVDADADGIISRIELLAFFEKRDDGDLVWDMGPPEEEDSGAAEGSLAPDFALQPPHGGDAVRLSDFRGESPVALVFGSYT